MTKQKIYFLIPFIITVALLMHCWIVIISTNILATWRHYVGLSFFLLLVFCYFKYPKLSLAGLGAYLLLATCNVLAITPEITTNWLRIGPVETPPIQLLSLGLLVLYGILNLDPLIEIYLDYKEAKQNNPLQ